MIKLAPLVLEARSRGLDARIVCTGQHREMIAPFLKYFGLKPDYDLEVLRPEQSLADLSASILTKIKPVLEMEKPDYVFVQGDTTTAAMSALAAFYSRIPVVHIEAGLRTHDRYSPFPEEINRQIISRIAEWHFAPTEASKKNLENEGIRENVRVTGNTGIDALRMVTTNQKLEASPGRMILVTCHRRENHGEALERICNALLRLVAKYSDLSVVFPVHLNPSVQKTVRARLADHPRIHLCDPVGYEDFALLMKRSYLILTDSGGIQEESPYLKKPVFVLRESTERPEGIAAGVSMLLGSDENRIVETIGKALDDPGFYAEFQRAVNPYGDGYASSKILDFIGF